jgi:hypothetical protein
MSDDFPIAQHTLESLAALEALRERRGGRRNASDIRVALGEPVANTLAPEPAVQSRKSLQAPKAPRFQPQP